MIKKATIFLIIIMLLLTMVSCKSKYANELFDDLEIANGTMGSWYVKINYIGETRGSTDEIYAKIKSNGENANEMTGLLNYFYGASISSEPSGFIFSAEGMSDYLFEFYKDDEEFPSLAFYYNIENNLLTRVTHSINKKDGKEYVNYEFYTPYGDLTSVASSYRQIAREPDKEISNLSLNPAQLIASVEPAELEERLDYDIGGIEFELYDGDLPGDQGTACKMYDSEDILSLNEDQVVIVATIASKTGEPQDLLITFLEYNAYYTIVSVSYPNEELQQELGIETQNAILINRNDIDPDKYIVFLDENNEVVYVIVPFVG